MECPLTVSGQHTYIMYKDPAVVVLSYQQRGGQFYNFDISMFQIQSIQYSDGIVVPQGRIRISSRDKLGQ